MIRPPADLPVNLLWQSGLTISQAASAVAVTVLVWKRSSSDTRLANLQLLLAGGWSFLLEAIADPMLQIWHPVIGQWTLFTAFGHSVPIWVSFVFYWAFGGQAVWMLSALRRGATSFELWRLYWLFGFTDLLFEMPPLWFDVYRHYGAQPLVWLPWIALPLYLPFGNALVPIFAAIAVHGVGRSTASSQLGWGVIPPALTAVFCGLMTDGWPVALALNSNYGVSDTGLAVSFPLGSACSPWASLRQACPQNRSGELRKYALFSVNGHASSPLFREFIDQEFRINSPDQVNIL